MVWKRFEVKAVRKDFRSSGSIYVQGMKVGGHHGSCPTIMLG